MSEGIGTCKKNNEEEIRQSILSNSRGEESPVVQYNPPSEDSKFYGLESHFNKDVIFYQNVTVHGKINYNFAQSSNFIFQNLSVIGPSTFLGTADFYDDVYIDNNLNVAGIVTAKQQLDVGCGGTTLTASSETSRVGILEENPKQTLDVNGTAIFSDKVGIGVVDPKKELDVDGTAIVTERIGVGTTDPEQRIDVAGSIKIDENIYDSANNPAQNGYFLTRDRRGIRWVPLIAESRPEVPGIGTTDGIFVLDEMVPLYPS